MINHIRIPVIVMLSFVLGLIGGAYYHQEINVWWGTLWQAQDHSVSQNVVKSPSSSSVIILPGLEEELPLVYSDTLDEATIQQYLKGGAVVLPLGTSFGESGNVVVTAHSSGTEAFGPYRFAFAKLSELEEGQEYQVKTPTATYAYRVYKKEIVWPHEVDKLPQDDRSTLTLVTCWPLWTNFQRLLVHTELVSVDFNV
jgi:LPXTG-site transpeptidase (sortase) family protein